MSTSNLIASPSPNPPAGTSFDEARAIEGERNSLQRARRPRIAAAAAAAVLAAMAVAVAVATAAATTESA